MDTVVLLGMMGVAAIGLIVVALRPSKKNQQDALARRMVGKSSTDENAEIREKARESVTAKMMERIAPLAMRPVMPKSGGDMT